MVIKGRVHMHTSPYHHNVFHGLFKSMARKSWKKIADNFFDFVPAAAIYGTVFFWANWKIRDNEKKHWF